MKRSWPSIYSAAENFLVSPDTYSLLPSKVCGSPDSDHICLGYACMNVEHHVHAEGYSQESKQPETLQSSEGELYMYSKARNALMTSKGENVHAHGM